ncbi:hypothetical protein HBA97_02955 [Mycobacteroides chelonae]|nr:hypothetical protein [Mycobacteroides chelonae]QQG86326.1 hypothetical protein HBA99_02955 [Mycobacteroides chelonae]QQG91143.1 hypothetical protein HBA97_02955 [Mycobacteroides chelonae]
MSSQRSVRSCIGSVPAVTTEQGLRVSLTSNQAVLAKPPRAPYDAELPLPSGRIWSSTRTQATVPARVCEHLIDTPVPPRARRRDHDRSRVTIASRDYDFFSAFSR